MYHDDIMRVSSVAVRVIWFFFLFVSRNGDYYLRPGQKYVKRYTVALPGSVYAPRKNDFSRTPIQQCSVLRRVCTLAYRHDPRTIFIVSVRYIVIMPRVSAAQERARRGFERLFCTNNNNI